MPTETLVFFSLKDDLLVKQVRIHPERDTAELRNMPCRIYNKYLYTCTASINTCALVIHTVTLSRLNVYQTEQLNKKRTLHSEKLC
jgi:hypothetical protein